MLLCRTTALSDSSEVADGGFFRRLALVLPVGSRNCQECLKHFPLLGFAGPAPSQTEIDCPILQPIDKPLLAGSR